MNKKYLYFTALLTIQLCISGCAKTEGITTLNNHLPNKSTIHCKYFYGSGASIFSHDYTNSKIFTSGNRSDLEFTMRKNNGNLEFIYDDKESKESILGNTNSCPITTETNSHIIARFDFIGSNKFSSGNLISETWIINKFTGFATEVSINARGMDDIVPHMDSASVTVYRCQ